MYDWETFQTAYQAATDEQRAFLDTETIPQCVKDAIASGTVDTSLHKKVVRLCALHAMQAIDGPTAETEMTKLGIPNSAHVFTSLINCMNRPVPTAGDLTADIAETEAALQKTVQGIRTMADDVNRAQGGAQDEPTYSSTQAAILQEGEQEATDTPRWESDGK